MAKRKRARPAARPGKGSQKAAKVTARTGAATVRGRKRIAPKRGPSRKAAAKNAAKARTAPKAAKAGRTGAKRPKPATTKAAKPAGAAAKTRAARKKAGAGRTGKRSTPLPRKAAIPAKEKAPRLDRARRTLDDSVQGPPSSLDLDRRGSAVRTGRAEMAQSRENLGDMGALTRGDVDADAENAYFSGDEAPGGDNPTPDQDIVDEIGRAIGVQYQDNEELRSSDKVIERDKHRWELDPASAEDYRDRK